MDPRLQAYQDLIEALLICTEWDERIPLLQAHPDLVNPELLQVIDQRIQTVAGSDPGQTERLQELGQGLDRVLTSQDQFKLLMQVLQATSDSSGDPNVVYPILQAHVNWLDQGFLDLLNSWGSEALAQSDLEKVQTIASVIGNFSTLILQFPLGFKAINVEIGILGYELALQVLTRDALPIEWAMTQTNFGNAYLYRIRGERGENLERAIAAYELALQVHTRDALPWNHAETQFNLGLALTDIRRLPEAEAAFKAAIDTAEALRHEITLGSQTYEDKQKLAESFNGSYRGQIEIYLLQDQPQQALITAERSKTRNLYDQLLIRESQQPLQDPPPPITYPQIRQLLDDQTALIEWYLFRDCFRAFILIPTQPDPIVWTSSADDLDQLVQWINQWFEKEAQGITDYEAWITSMDPALQQLSQILHLQDLLKHIPTTCQRLILIPHRYLHLLPIHTLLAPKSPQDPDTTLLMDHFPQGIHYAPSCQILHQINTRHRPHVEKLFVIQNPTPDLYQNYEADLGSVDFIANSFPATILKNQQATLNQVLNHPNLAQTHQLLSFCHGSFNPQDPLASALSLADAPLTLQLILDQLQLDQCYLVTLSACESGRVDFEDSDEYLGLSGGFLLAGSINVISPLWSVAQIPTSLLISHLYHQLRHDHHAIARTLHQSQRWLRDSTLDQFRQWIEDHYPISVNKFQLINYFKKEAAQHGSDHQPFANPYYWAGFCAVGQGKHPASASDPLALAHRDPD